MKKRLVCSLLVLAMTLGEVLSAGAVTVSDNTVGETAVEEAKEADTAEDAQEIESEEATVVDESELSEETAGGISTDEKIIVAQGTDYILDFLAPASTSCTFEIYNGTTVQGESIWKKTISTSATISTQNLGKVTLDTKDLPVGNYTLVYCITGSEKNTSEITIAKSIDKKVNTNITKLEVPYPVFTGKEVKPTAIIQENVDGKTYSLVEGKDYTIAITSDNKVDLGPIKVEVKGINAYMGTVTVDAQIAPQSPVIKSLKVENFNSITVTWAKVPQATGYYIDRKDKNGEFNRVGTVADVDQLSFTDNTAGLVLGNTYYYRVIAFKQNGTDSLGTMQYVESTPDEDGQAITMEMARPKITSIVSPSTTKLTVTWTKVEGANGYKLYRVNADGSLKLVASTTNTTYSESKLTCGKTYKYVVKAYVKLTDFNNTIIYSDVSDVVKATAKTATPVMVSAKSVSNKKNTIKWKRVANASGYAILRKVYGETSYKRIKFVKGGKTVSYTDTKAVVGTRYVYSVKAYKLVNGKKVYSAYDTKGKAVRNLPAAPFITAKQIGGKVEVAIANAAGADGYYVYRKQDNGKYKKLGEVDNSTGTITYFNDTKMSYKKNYTYMVRPYVDNDNGIYRGPKSNEVKVSTK